MHERAMRVGVGAAILTVTIASASAGPPAAPGINAPQPGGRVNVPRPTLRVDNAVDPDGDVLTYEFAVYRDAQLTTLHARQVGIAAGAGTTSWQVTMDLVEDRSYHWRARATDAGGLAGAWSPAAEVFSSTTNAPPEPPIILAPTDGSLQPWLRPQLVFSNAGDRDRDALVFDFDLARDVTFSQIVQSGVDVEPAPGPHTAAALAADLAEDTRYCWRVRSDDRQATSPYSFACFLVSERNDPPSVPVLNTPSDTLAATTTFPVFSWGPSTDPEGAAVSYEVEVTDGAGQLVAQVQGASGTVTPIPGELVNGAIYQWRARATDAAGLSSEWSPQSAFAVDAPVDEPPVDDRDDIGACHAGGGASAGGLGALVVVAAALASRRRRRGVGLGLVCAAGLVGGPSLARAQTPGDTAAPPAAATPRAGVPTGLAVEVRLDSGQTFLDDDFVIPSFSSGLHLGYRARSVIVGLGLEAPSA